MVILPHHAPHSSSLTILLLITISHSRAFYILAPLVERSRTVLSAVSSDAPPAPSSNRPVVIYEGFWHEAKAMMDARQSSLPWKSQTIPFDLQRKVCTTPAKGKRLETVTVAEVFAYTVPGRIRQARAAVLSTIPEEAPPKVLNFVVFPDSSYDLPIFGADFVSLPGGHLVVLDFQPVSSTSLSVAEKALRDIHAHYTALLPSHGEIPDAARSFFSPYYMFIRVEGDALVETTVLAAFKAYFSAYLDLVEHASPIRVEETSRLLEVQEGHRNYATYRAVNDPARGMLTRMYGRSWTERLIYEVLFEQADRELEDDGGITVEAVRSGGTGG